ncbi:MAG: glycosyltransferase family 4 protein [archaeon]
MKEKKLALIHQLARGFWLYEVPVFGILGWLLEPLYMRLYSKTKTVTVSGSTKKDLKSWGFKDITIVSEGIDFAPLGKPAVKEKDFTLIFVGRMKKAKKPQDAVRAFRMIKKEIPSARLWMIGRGYINFKKTDSITHFGRIDSKKKHILMSRAHILLVPAVREGWGLVVTEANALSTPAISYDVPGLRDSVKHKRTGLLCKNNPKAMAGSAISLFNDKKRLKEYTLNALKDSKNHTWDRSAKEFLSAMESAKTY